MQITPFFRTIHAPVVTGVPPANPHRDFMKMPDGELRHYGMRAFRENGKISLTRLVAKSDDCGLNWREEILTSPTVGAMGKESLERGVYHDPVLQKAGSEQRDH